MVASEGATGVMALSAGEAHGPYAPLAPLAPFSLCPKNRCVPTVPTDTPSARTCCTVASGG